MGVTWQGFPARWLSPTLDDGSIQTGRERPEATAVLPSVERLLSAMRDGLLRLG